MAIDTLVLAGDRKGAKLVYGANKAFLMLRGKPLVSYVLSALDRSEEVRSIHIVGPVERMRELLSEFKYQKPVFYIEQGENIFQNIWLGALHTFPQYQRGADYKNLSHLPEANKIVLATTCDMPMLEPVEIDTFIRQAPINDYDLIFGVTRKEMLLPFLQTKNSPGFTFAYFCFKDQIIRHANIFLLRPLKLGYVMEEFIPMIYSFRYQKKWRNILGSLSYILSLGIGLRSIYYFLMLQMAKSADLNNRRKIRDWARKRITLKQILDYAQPIMQTRFTTQETIGPGTTLDADSEEELAIFEQNFDQWKQIQSQILQGNYTLPEQF